MRVLTGTLLDTPSCIKALHVFLIQIEGLQHVAAESSLVVARLPKHSKLTRTGRGDHNMVHEIPYWTGHALQTNIQKTLQGSLQMTTPSAFGALLQFTMNLLGMQCVQCNFGSAKGSPQNDLLKQRKMGPGGRCPERCASAWVSLSTPKKKTGYVHVKQM